jgi:hypothetical protein
MLATQLAVVPVVPLELLDERPVVPVELALLELELLELLELELALELLELLELELELELEELLELEAAVELELELEVSVAAPVVPELELVLVEPVDDVPLPVELLAAAELDEVTACDVEPVVPLPFPLPAGAAQTPAAAHTWSPTQVWQVAPSMPQLASEALWQRPATSQQPPQFDESHFEQPWAPSATAAMTSK